MKHIYHIAPKRSGHAFVGNMIKDWCEEYRYHDYENVLPRVFNSRHKADSNTIVIVQTRDFLNWFASYYTAQGNINIGISQMWKAITAEYYKPFYLKKYKLIRICYDTFFYNKEYRFQLCEQLNGTYNEHMLQKITNNGGGSSFTKQHYNGVAQNMNVLNRYKQVSPEIYIKIFNRSPGLLKFYKRHCVDKEKLEFLNDIL